LEAGGRQFSYFVWKGVSGDGRELLRIELRAVKMRGLRFLELVVYAPGHMTGMEFLRSNFMELQVVEFGGCWNYANFASVDEVGCRELELGPTRGLVGPNPRADDRGVLS
jgi:hypothetical protein